MISSPTVKRQTGRHFPASLREGGGPRSGGRSKRVRNQRRDHCRGRIWNPILRRMAKRREDDILSYRHLNISAYPDPIQSFNSSLFTITYSLAAVANARAAPPLPLSKTSALPNLPKTFFSLRRQAKHHAEGASLSACGKHHSPQANFTVQSPRGGCTLCLPPGGRGTAKRWKETAGMKATICLL